MKAIARTVVSVIAVAAITAGLVELINLDAMASVINEASETTIWIEFRTFLGVYGAESEENLMFVTYVFMSLLLSVTIVALVNRLMSTRARTLRARRVALMHTGELRR